MLRRIIRLEEQEFLITNKAKAAEVIAAYLFLFVSDSRIPEAHSGLFPKCFSLMVH